MNELIPIFFSAVFLFNAVPHLVRGICGQRHMTPLSPRSGPVVNVVWAWINLLLGGWLLRAASAPARWELNEWAAFCAGGFLIAVFLAAFWANPDARLPWHKRA